MAGSAWDAVRGCCVDIPASLPLQGFDAVEEATNNGILAVVTYLQAMRRASATAEVSRFNGLMLNPDYRQRFLDAYPTGKSDGMQAAFDEIVTEIDTVLKTIFVAAEAVLTDPTLQDDLVAATATMWLRPIAMLSESQNRALDARLDGLQKRLLPGYAQAPEVGAIPFSGVRESTRQTMQAVTSLQVWRAAITSPGKLSLGGFAVDSIFKSGQDWENVFVGAEDDMRTMFAMTTEGLLQLNCDPTGQGYNLGWIVGYMAIWIPTIVVFETVMALESPI